MKVVVENHGSSTNDRAVANDDLLFSAQNYAAHADAQPHVESRARRQRAQDAWLGIAQGIASQGAENFVLALEYEFRTWENTDDRTSQK